MSLRRLLLAAIRAYQRWVSPHKGFCCAYRVHTGRASCSTLGLRAVRRHGVFKGLGLIRRRTHLCGVAHRRHALAGLRRVQGGFIDCDLPCSLDADLSCLEGMCDVADCCSCDWPSLFSRRKRQGFKHDKEAVIWLPPESKKKYGPD